MEWFVQKVVAQDVLGKPEEIGTSSLSTDVPEEEVLLAFGEVDEVIVEESTPLGRGKGCEVLDERGKELVLGDSHWVSSGSEGVPVFVEQDRILETKVVYSSRCWSVIFLRPVM